ncbi:aldo/keto reductase [Propionibacterium australiense]|uniref:Aldo/keto reductase n=1 Tax=Propionibacterium australiense TaxID=119981 RepID=A0A383S920_9ACTN|nr:aldo/keto reductase [Propionibacterium australiense]RLP06586.1 aldo/keto reductase [Propionibacterium australiense]RLP10752.1 aldo/keto reductase [Propionibacterium australiense]SYZ34407.1 Aldo/keto reductase family signature 2 [Propionibacterium australiense]VEH89841.1 Glyoxal reductase [Propionibacterium australiense]
MAYDKQIRLNDGSSIPALGLGTWLIDDADAAQAVKDAVAVGYRHIDTAQAYRNETGVGTGIRECGVPRDELFVTTKVAAEHKSYDSAAASIDESLARLGLDYVDLLIIHSPQPWAEFRADDNHYYAENLDAWRALEDARTAGRVRSIGVSNFLVDDVRNIIDNARVKPAVNQVLAHVGNTPFELIDFCQSNDVVVEAYSPVAHGAILDNEEVAAIAAGYGVSVPQLCIRYVLQLGLVALPKTANRAHMEQNATLDFTISEDDMATLRAVGRLASYGEHSFFPVFRTQLD